MHACIYTHSTVHILYVTLCMGGSKGATKVMYVAHIGVLQLPIGMHIIMLELPVVCTRIAL